MAGSGDLLALLEEFFGACYAALADTPGGQPECAYISEGPPAWDACPCLVVYAGGPSVGDTFPLQPTLAPLHRSATNGQVNLISMTALALRCAPSLGDEGEPQLPQPADHLKASAEVYGDTWALWNHLVAAKRAGTLFPPREREFGMQPGIAQNPAGGAAGAAISVTVQLDGYTPA